MCNVKNLHKLGKKQSSCVFVSIFRTRAARHRVRGAMEGSADAAAGSRADAAAGGFSADAAAGGSSGNAAAETVDFGEPAPPNTPAEPWPSDNDDGTVQAGSSANAAAGGFSADAAAGSRADAAAGSRADAAAGGFSADAAAGSRADTYDTYHGHLALPDGSFYDGDLRDGKYHGKGTLEYSGGYRREGIWRDGKLVKELSNTTRAQRNKRKKEAEESRRRKRNLKVVPQEGQAMPASGAQAGAASGAQAGADGAQDYGLMYAKIPSEFPEEIKHCINRLKDFMHTSFVWSSMETPRDKERFYRTLASYYKEHESDKQLPRMQYLLRFLKFCRRA